MLNSFDKLVLCLNRLKIYFSRINYCEGIINTNLSNMDEIFTFEK